MVYFSGGFSFLFFAMVPFWGLLTQSSDLLCSLTRDVPAVSLGEETVFVTSSARVTQQTSALEKRSQLAFLGLPRKTTEEPGPRQAFDGGPKVPGPGPGGQKGKVLPECPEKAACVPAFSWESSEGSRVGRVEGTRTWDAVPKGSGEF